MFIVTGFSEGVGYRVGINPDTTPETTVTGSQRIQALLDLYEGHDVLAFPTGPLVTVDHSDPVSLLGALYGLTRVTQVEGEAPALHEQATPGTVY